MRLKLLTGLRQLLFSAEPPVLLTLPLSVELPALLTLPLSVGLSALLELLLLKAPLYLHYQRLSV